MNCLLYYITDRNQFQGDQSARRRAVLAKIQEAASAGVDYIQLRELDLNPREMELLAREALARMQDSMGLGTWNGAVRTQLLINSRADVALAVGANGVHLRGEDVSANDIREVFKTSARPPTTAHLIVAASCHTVAEVARAADDKADFAVFAPVFGKSRFPGTQPTGVAILREACQAAKIRIFALGGVTTDNAASCLSAGAAGVAGIRLFQENKIEEVVRRLRNL